MEDMVEEKVKVPISWEFGGPDKCELGDLITFDIFAKDLQGNPFEVKPLQLSGILWINDKSRGMCEEEGNLRKVGVGAYALDFVPQILGTHQLRLQNGHIQLFKDQEIKVEVLKETTDIDLAYDFELEGKALLSARLDEIVNLNITVKEKGSSIDIDMDKFEVKVFGNGRGKMCGITRRGVGSYLARFQTSAPGVYGATVIYDGNKVLKQTIKYYEHTSARCSKIDNVPVTVKAGKANSFTIQSLDMHGNLTGIGGDLWEIKITEGPTPAAQVPLNIDDHLNGKYTVNFILSAPGQYKVDVRIKGENAKKSPFKIKAE